MSRFDDLARERRVLQARSNILRNRLATQVQGFQPVLQRAAQVQAGAQTLMSRPLTLAVVGILAALVRPARLAGWSAKAWTAWKVWTQLRGLWGGRR